MKKHRLLSSAILLLAAAIWGVAFVAQDAAADTVEPFTMNAVRSLIASVALIPVAAVIRRINGKPLLEQSAADRKTLLIAGTSCGVLLCIAVNLQQFGITIYPDDAAAAGRAGFITALYIIFVPLFGLFSRKKPGLFALLALLPTVAGLYLLCLGDGIRAVYLGDLVMLGCAATFALQILTIDRFIDRVDGVKLSSIQFLTCGVLSMIMMFIFEHPSLTMLLGAWKSILYLALLSSAVGYTLQIIGQKYSDNPTLASILMSMESVFALLGGMLIGSERMGVKQLIGCALMLLAIIVAQLPSEWISRIKK